MDTSIDSSVQNEQEFNEWMQHLESLSPEERSKIILDKIKERVTKRDGKALDLLYSILKEHPDENTNMSFLVNEMQKTYPMVNPLTILSYMSLLNIAGLITVDNNPIEDETLNEFITMTEVNKELRESK